MKKIKLSPFYCKISLIEFEIGKWGLELENYLSDYMAEHNIWGHPIRITCNQWHVYGVSKTTYKAIWIDITHRYIAIMKWD